MARLSFALIAVLTLVLAAAIVLASVLQIVSVRNDHSRLVETRLVSVGEAIAEQAEAALTLGLPLPGQTALSRSLARNAQVDPAIDAIAVFGADGRMLFSSDNRVYADGTSIPIRSAFGTEEGKVVVVPATRVLRERIENFSNSVWRTALLSILAASLAMLVIAALVIRRLRQQLRDDRHTALLDAVAEEHSTIERHLASRSQP